MLDKPTPALPRRRRREKVGSGFMRLERESSSRFITGKVGRNPMSLEEAVEWVFNSSAVILVPAHLRFWAEAKII
jgi:hypothetical protein